MKTLNKTTKKAAQYLNSYNRSRIFDIYEAYEKPSSAKIKADYFCKEQMYKEGGHGYKIIGYNCNFFTVAWIAGNNLRIETASNSFVIPEAL